MEKYLEFIKQKQRNVSESGFIVKDEDLNPFLFDFQKYLVRKALRKGRFAIFGDCGLGKTIIQLDWANQIIKHENKPVLIITPLAVSKQTIHEGNKFGINVLKFNNEYLPKIYITNYEQLDNIQCGLFAGVVLDESSILKNFEGKTKKSIIDKFKNTQYKLACTATPSPNDIMELANHSEFLNVISREEMLAMYFIHDGGETSKWRLKKHGNEMFWVWVSEWASLFTNPIDLGFDGHNFILPKLNLIENQIKTKRRNNGKLFNETVVSAINFNQELRLTKIERLNKVIEIINNNKNENFIVWVKQNEEADYIKKLIPDSVEVRGNDNIEYKENRLLGFANNEFRVLITKTKIAQFGMNYQNCSSQIFASLDFSFEALYQAIRRSYRFGQKKEVNVYLITTDTMQNVIDSIKTKEQQFKEMQKYMIESIKENIIEENNTTSETCENKEYKTNNCLLQMGDCVQLIQKIADESIGFSIFSPPFADLYVYSDKPEDMGNCKDYNEFLFAFKFLVKELYRVLWSGRNVAVHCMDLPIQKGKEGYIGLRDFSNMIRQSFEDVGFIYHSRITIWKNPVTEMQRTKALGLLHKQVKKDASMSRVGLPDYVLVFRKDGEHKHPVKCDIPVSLWQQYASPVWMDINYQNTLNARIAREDKDEKHICPLQLETIERCIHLWSNENDTVLSPFMGIGSEVCKALEMNRNVIGFELKKSYFDAAVKNVKNIEIAKCQKKLF